MGVLSGNQAVTKSYNELMSDNSGSIPPKLDPSSLYSEQEKRDQLKLKTYNSILETVHNKIRINSRMPNNDKSLLFVVPEFVMGVPRFSTRDCILYLVWNLRNTNFDVQYIHPNLLYISWKKHDDQYRDERNPIVKTMKNAIDETTKSRNVIIEESTQKSVIKKTTQNYFPNQKEQESYTKKVTFI